MSRPRFCLSNVSTNDCPCKGCTSEEGRHTGCHSTCELYLDWDKSHKKKLSETRRRRKMDDVYYEGAARRNKALKQKGVSFGRDKK